MEKIEINGMEYRLYPITTAETGAVFGVQMETYPVKWRTVQALDALAEGDLKDVGFLLVNILREVTLAEMIGVPMLIPAAKEEE